MRRREVGLIAVSAAGLLAVVALAQRTGRERRPGREDAESFQHPPLAKNEAEKKILNVLNDLHRNQRRGMMNVPVEDGRLLRVLTESNGAKHVVEIDRKSTRQKTSHNL